MGTAVSKRYIYPETRPEASREMPSGSGIEWAKTIMMREIEGVVQGEPATRRRWFHDEYFDLFVWQNSADAIESFQLCYGIDSSERALEWRKSRGFFHDGAKAPAPDGILDARSPTGGEPSAAAMTSRFEFAARALPDDIREAVTARIREYADKAVAVPARRRQVRRAAWQQQGPEPS